MRKIVTAFVLIMTLLLGTIVSAAASDPAVSIVSPGQTSYGSTLLVSVKVTQPKTVRIAVYEQKEKVRGQLVAIRAGKQASVKKENVVSVTVMSPQTFTCKNNLGFYNKQLTNVSPGLYKITVSTLNSAGNVVATTNSLVMVEPKAAASSVSFESQSALQWLRNIFKDLFS